MNPFTRERFEYFDVAQAIEPARTESRPTGAVLLPTPGAESRSHFRGRPMLAANAQWPSGPNGALSFLVCIDFSELGQVAAGAHGMPSSGFLNVFYDTGGGDWSVATDGPSHWRLLFETGEARELPGDVDGAVEHSSVPMQFQVDKAQLEHSPRHRLGGSPEWLQSDQRAWLHFISGRYLVDDAVARALREAGLEPDILRTSDQNVLLRAAKALEAAGVDPSIFDAGVSEWRLLLQLDSDESLSLEWGDAGRLYVMIPEPSLASCSFGDAWICWQCY